MSTLEQHLQDEVDRLKEWAEGKDFRLNASYVGENRCSRCGEVKPRMWALTQNPCVNFGAPADVPLAVPLAVPLTHRSVCRECLSADEVAELLRPVAIFCLQVLIARNPSKEVTHSAAHIKAYFEVRSSSPPSATGAMSVALRALDGIGGVPIPEIDFNRLYSELEGALARNMYLAAHPDEVPESVEAARAIETKVRIFFRDGASIERYALRDSVTKCIEIFRKYFTRKP